MQKDASGSEFVSVLVDVAELPMELLDDLPDTVLAEQLRRVVGEALNPTNEAFAAFQSALSDLRQQGPGRTPAEAPPY
ncbi:FxSxx-COOH cyclophane-containing RiPP peptide [Streptomyces sp. 2A115]|uniref:FxSxx-COOH cyclophane-containing RiPP peptide n=1 Tax=Streptomyces sp. 2A115 TaxID=3457439 RepID=UPI003FD1FEB2